MVLVWPILFELVWFFIQSFRTSAWEINPRSA